MLFDCTFREEEDQRGSKTGKEREEGRKGGKEIGGEEGGGRRRGCTRKKDRQDERKGRVEDVLPMPTTWKDWKEGKAKQEDKKREGLTKNKEQFCHLCLR